MQIKYAYAIMVTWVYMTIVLRAELSWEGEAYTILPTDVIPTEAIPKLPPQEHPKCCCNWVFRDTDLKRLKLTW